MNAVRCPWCGETGTSVVVSHAGMRYLCGCGSTHNGTTAEFKRLEATRADRRAYMFTEPAGAADLTATGGVIEEF